MTADRKRPRIFVLVCWSAVVLIALCSAVGIALLAPSMAPVRKGNSHMFWKIATGVSLSPNVDDAWGDAYIVDDVWAAYDSAHYHGSDIYRVSVADVSADFDAVVSMLEQAVQRGEDSPFLKGYVNWRDDDDKPRDSSALLEDIKRARNRDLIEDNIDLLAYRVAGEQQFWQRWQRADWYWASIVFEWTFLTGLALFSVWPAIRHHSALRWAIHVAFLPLFFLLPTYLGYATNSFTSAGPSGGILYPFLLRFCRGGSFTSVDSWLMERTPQVLEPLSVPIGSPIALSGMGLPGPTYAILAGVVAGVCLFVAIAGFKRWDKRRSKHRSTLDSAIGGR